MSPRNRSKTTKERWNNLIDEAERQGFKVTPKSDGHVMFASPSGQAITTHSRAAVNRGYGNSWMDTIKRLRRIGLEWPPPTPVVAATYPAVPSLAHLPSANGTSLAESGIGGHQGYAESQKTDAPLPESAIETLKKEQALTGAYPAGQRRRSGPKWQPSGKAAAKTGVPEGWSRSLANSKEYRNKQRALAQKVLKEILRDGPVEIYAIRDAALSVGVSWKAAQDQAKELGIVRRSHGPTHPGTWELPPSLLFPMYGEAAVQEVPESPRPTRKAPQAPAPAAEAPAEDGPTEPATGAQELAQALEDGKATDVGLPASWNAPQATQNTVEVQGKQYSADVLTIAEFLAEHIKQLQSEMVSRNERLEQENSELRQKLADLGHEQEKDWQEIERLAEEAAAQAIRDAMAKRRKK